MTAARFTRHVRLTQAGDFEAVFKQGKRFSEKKLVALVISPATPHPRLGLAVPKKIVADSVDRNRIKRHVRESFRLHLQRLPPADIVILARPGSGKANAAELRATLERLWNRISVQCAPA